LTTTQIPVHGHAFLATTALGVSPNPGGNLASAAGNIDLYRETAANTPMGATAVGPVGGSQPHTNFQPYLCVDFIISLFGIFPSPT
jgi:microcystin-dependent protein